MKKFAFLLSFLFLTMTSCSAQPAIQEEFKQPNMGANRLDNLLPLLKNKKVALVVNQTSCLDSETHLLDTLLTLDVNVKKILAPEHGFRGEADAGQTIVDGKDSKTETPVVSLYGKNKKPTKEQLSDIDIVVFDIQDVGTRFFTYISTMHYVMEACAENNKTCIILDRPNPNDYIDGPILDPKFRSFIGMHKIPILHGLTVGELAQMINGEKWLANGVQCKLEIIPIENWEHGQEYLLPIKPSPNLPNDQAIKLYPSLCFFEATDISIGRGTSTPFQIVGAPNKAYGAYSFTPKSVKGATNPPLKGQVCYGLDLTKLDFVGGLNLEYFLDFYNKTTDKTKFFARPKFMDLLAGTDQLRLQILAGNSEIEIRASWAKDLQAYKTMRAKYLLYPDMRE